MELSKKFWNATAWVLEVAADLSFILGRYLDFYIIIALIVFNAFLSFSEEQKANKALEILKSKLQVQAGVLRDGDWKLIPAKLLVPGDIVRVRAGDLVPADVKIIHGEVEVDQSALTGESLSVYRRDNENIYSGSIIRRGEATGIVILTGNNAYLVRQLISQNCKTEVKGRESSIKDRVLDDGYCISPSHCLWYCFYY